MLRMFIDDRFIKTLEIIITLFGFFMIYQVLRSVFGGSWNLEPLILGLLMLNISLTVALGFLYAQLKSDVNHLRGQFNAFASDFKLQSREAYSLKSEINLLKIDMESLKHQNESIKKDLNKIKRKLGI